jgi:surfactin synthase thioesterase subunit
MTQAGITLLCLPYAGACATVYLRWRRLLPAHVRLVPMELPGRGRRFGEPALRQIDRLADLLADEIAPYTTGRYALFGHSMGSLLAWRVTHRLREQRRRLPAALFVSGGAAPTRRDPERFADLHDDDALIAELRKHGGTPDEVFADRDLLRLTLDLLDADYRVCESFRHRGEPALPMPIHAFGGRDDPIDADDMQAWARETDAAFTLDWFDGGHFFLHAQEAALVAQLNDHLAVDLADLADPAFHGATAPA